MSKWYNGMPKDRDRTESSFVESLKDAVPSLREFQSGNQFQALKTPRYVPPMKDAWVLGGYGEISIPPSGTPMKLIDNAIIGYSDSRLFPEMQKLVSGEKALISDTYQLLIKNNSLKVYREKMVEESLQRLKSQLEKDEEQNKEALENLQKATQDFNTHLTSAENTEAMIIAIADYLIQSAPRWENLNTVVKQSLDVINAHGHTYTADGVPDRKTGTMINQGSGSPSPATNTTNPQGTSFSANDKFTNIEKVKTDASNGQLEIKDSTNRITYG